MQRQSLKLNETLLEGIREELQAVHDKLVAVDRCVHQLLQGQSGLISISETGPRVFQVVDRGVCHGPFTDDELAAWRGKDVDLLFDTVKNEVSIRRPDARALEPIPFGPHANRRELSSVLSILQILAEHPGQRLTPRLFGAYPGQTAPERNTFAKYIKRIRDHLGDTNPHRFILTDESVAIGCSLTGCAYYANPDLHWRVIRLIPALVSS